MGSLSAAVKAGLARDARGLLGGDVELQLFHRTADARERDYLAARGQISEVAQLRAMARTLDGERTSLIELKSVDAAYPLYGAVTLAVAGGQPAPSLAEALALKEGHWGAVVAPALMDRLGIKEGDSIRVGDAVLTIARASSMSPTRSAACSSSARA